MAVDALDIELFIVALFDPQDYDARWPDCNVMLADVNEDGAIDVLDIQPFIEALFQ